MPRKNVNQPAWDFTEHIQAQDLPVPSALTPVATRQATLITQPSGRAVCAARLRCTPTPRMTISSVLSGLASARIALDKGVSMVRLLLVANKTLDSGEVSRFVRERMAKDDNCQFTLLVPATPHGGQPGSRMANEIANAGSGVRVSDVTEGVDDWEYARSRLEYGLSIMRVLGATVDGEVGDANPARAITEILKLKTFDEVVLSTLPKGISRWLGLDIPHQIQRRFHVPVTVIKVRSVPS